MFKTLALSTVLATGLAFSALAGSVTDNVTVTGTNTVSGIGNSGSLAIDNIGNGDIKNRGRGGDVTKNVTATFDQTVSGIDNSGSLAASGIGNGDIRNGSKRHEPKRVEYEPKHYDTPFFYAPTVKSKAVNR